MRPRQSLLAVGGLVLVVAGCGPASTSSHAGSGGGNGSGGSSSGGSPGSGGSGSGGGNGSGGSSCARRELFTNGNFDAGNTDWNESSDKWPNVIVTADKLGGTVKAQSGNSLARLGGYPDMGQDGLLTSVEVPESAKDIVYSFYSIVTTEETSSERHDLLYIALDSDTVYSDSYIDNTNAHSSWQRFEANIDPAAAGKRLVLVMTGQNDGAKATTFLLDSFSLTANVCP